MKVIDLLNKIANNEEVPKYVKYKNHTRLGTEETMMLCKENLFYKLDQLEIYLNDEVEIIEEDKEIEHYDMFDNFTGFGFGGTDKELLSDLQNNFEHINEELDYLIKAVNELKKGK